MVEKFAYIKILPLLCTRFATGTAVQKQKWFIKIFSIFLRKNLEVRKTCLIFALAFAS